MDLSCEVDYFSILPDDILMDIFRHLTLEDRKNIRSTCRHFYELCDEFCIQSDEVIALYGCIHTVSAVSCFSRSSRRVQNIRMIKVPLRTDYILPLFKQQGTYVQSLHFEDCSFDPGTLKTIIECCVNLRSFVLESCSDIGYQNAVNDFRDLEINSIVRDKVTDLTLSVNVVHVRHQIMTNRKFRRFFAIFPNVKILDLRVKLPNPSWTDLTLSRTDFFSTEDSDFVSNTIFTYFCIYDRMLVLADQLEILRLDFNTHPTKSVIANHNIGNIQMKNLKKLSLNWTRLDQLLDVAFIQSSISKHLTRFSCYFFREPSASVSALLQYLLRHSPLLYLSITSPAIIFDVELFSALVQSKLRTFVSELLEIRSSIIGLLNVPPATLDETLVPNHSLQYMWLGKWVEPDLYLLFARYFRSLRRLEFPRVDGGVLQNILKEQRDLRSLGLRSGPRYKCHVNIPSLRKWLREEASSIDCEFKDLAYLDIIEDGCRYSLTNFVLSEFTFSNLQSLAIKLRHCLFDRERLWQLIRKLPNLLCLCLDLPATITFAQYLALFESPSKLRHFSMREENRLRNFVAAVFTEEMYKQLFKALPALRTFEHERIVAHNRRSKTVLYVYDVISKTIVKADGACLCSRMPCRLYYIDDKCKNFEQMTIL